MTYPETKLMINRLLKFTVVAGGIRAVEPKRTGMCLRWIHCLLGYALCASHTRRGATAPLRSKNEPIDITVFTFGSEYSTGSNEPPYDRHIKEDAVHQASPWTVRWQQ